MKTERYDAKTRGFNDAGWLHSNFSFSFANYYDPRRMGYGALRVLNDDIIEPANGFGMHEHDNMEIVTLVTEGVLEHKDSEGNGGTLRGGDVQVMSAGSGIAHSEFNPSDEEPLALFQMWITTKEQNIKPRYDQKTFEFRDNTLVAIASGDGEADALYIHQDASVFVGSFTAGSRHTHTIRKDRGLFVFCIEGTFEIDDDTIGRRDALEISGAQSVTFKTPVGGRIMLIETVV